MSWEPLSLRSNPNATEEALFEGVPAHLMRPLADWLLASVPTDALKVIAVRLHLPIETQHSAAVQRSLVAHLDDETVFLDVLDLSLRIVKTPDARRQLNSLLSLGGSAWKVDEAGTGLERRVDPTAAASQQEAVTAGTAAGGSAGTHLATAWSETYGLHPDATKAYSESIKAVEAAAAPVVTPNDLKATLGKMIGELRANPAKYEVEIGGAHAGDVGPVLALMSMLWDGQTDRHGGVAVTVPITAGQAAMAVHAAATLVQWFSTGLVRRR